MYCNREDDCVLHYCAAYGRTKSADGTWRDEPGPGLGGDLVGPGLEERERELFFLARALKCLYVHVLAEKGNVVIDSTYLLYAYKMS